MIKAQKQGGKDDYQTPPIALQPLLTHLDPKWKLWECAEGKGNLTQALKKEKFKVVGTDILQGKDFLKYEPKEYDCIITNPPFSKKQEFIERAYSLGKPFAFLLPITALESEKRQRFFKCCGIELILFKKRINFETPDGEGEGSWFATAWFTHQFNLGQSLLFSDMECPICQKQ